MNRLVQLEEVDATDALAGFSGLELTDEPTVLDGPGVQNIASSKSADPPTTCIKDAWYPQDTKGMASEKFRKVRRYARGDVESVSLNVMEFGSAASATTFLDYSKFREGCLRPDEASSETEFALPLGDKSWATRAKSATTAVVATGPLLVSVSVSGTVSDDDFTALVNLALDRAANPKPWPADPASSADALVQIETHCKYSPNGCDNSDGTFQVLAHRFCRPLKPLLQQLFAKVAPQADLIDGVPFARYSDSNPDMSCLWNVGGAGPGLSVGLTARPASGPERCPPVGGNNCVEVRAGDGATVTDLAQGDPSWRLVTGQWFLGIEAVGGNPSFESPAGGWNGSDELQAIADRFAKDGGSTTTSVLDTGD